MPSPSPISALLHRHLKIHQVCGANTSVGKTVLTNLLCRAARRLYPHQTTSFLKPVSTGPADEADERHLRAHCPGVHTKTLFQYDLAVSPHLAAAKFVTDGGVGDAAVPQDSEILKQIGAHCRERAASGPGWLFVETAGGVHSPSPSGSTQADLYAPLRLPVVLVGDAKLGGISGTVAAFESLHVRGYDVASVLLFRDETFGNAAYLKDYFGERHAGVRVTAVPPPPDRAESQSKEADEAAMGAYYDRVGSGDEMAETLAYLDRRHVERIARLEEMPTRAHETIWFPFTQQKMLGPEKITAIDSASGSYFQTLVPSSSTSTSSPSEEGQQQQQQSTSVEPALLRPSFDGSASWWTQGLGHGSPSLTLAAAHAAGRYGHVMFAEAVHEPALKLAETMLDGMRAAGNDRVSRVFFSDNGSTGVEVALKMALRAAGRRCEENENGRGKDGKNKEPVGVIALKGGYHGDTLGAMECAEPGVYNEKVEWYRGRGVWLDYPTVLFKDGEWRVDIPREMAGGEEGRTLVFESDSGLGSVFDLEQRKTEEWVVKWYEGYIERTVREYMDKGGRLGALLMEPVVVGAGGMMLVDPLFQHTLVNFVRKSSHLFGTTPSESTPANSKTSDWTGLPVIFDEVFTGLYRLGHFTPSTLLDCHPDISVHAKLLTGGLLPLSVTLASESVFAAFASDDKTDALLHGHSYTAHPVGCQVAQQSLAELDSMARRVRPAMHSESMPKTCGEVRTIWRDGFVDDLARHDAVAGVWALGSVLAIHMKAADGAGYKSMAAVRLRDALMEGERGWSVHCRVLGNVLYLMADLTVKWEDLLGVSRMVKRALGMS